MEDGAGARAHLAKAAAAITVLSLFPVALSGFAPSHASAALRHLYSSAAESADPTDNVPWSTTLFGAFSYESGRVSGTYVEFTYEPLTGTVRSILNLAGESPVLYLSSIEIGGFHNASAISATGPLFRAEGYFATFMAHDDPTVLLEVRSQMARTVTIELPPTASVERVVTSSSWPASSVILTVEGHQAQFFLGAGTLANSGTTIVVEMAQSDLLIFKSVPAGPANEAGYRPVLVAISLGQVVAELDLVATSEELWVQNTVRYRMDVDLWPLAVRPGKAAVQIDSPRPLAAVVIIAFDTETMPAGDSVRLAVRANGASAERTDAVPYYRYAASATKDRAAFAVLPLPGTVLAIYLPSVGAVSIDITSTLDRPPGPILDAGSQLAMIAALALVSVAAARMLRRRAR